jgi:hypothetical protein
VKSEFAYLNELGRNRAASAEPPPSKIVSRSARLAEGEGLLSSSVNMIRGSFPKHFDDETIVGIALLIEGKETCES